MNIARTQYIENDFVRHQKNGYQTFLPWVLAGKRLFALFMTGLRSGLVPMICCIVALANLVGYVTTINYGMVHSALLKQTQKEIKLIETSVLQKEIFLANARTAASLKKQKEIVLMKNVDNIYYISSNMSVAEALGNRVTR